MDEMLVILGAGPPHRGDVPAPLRWTGRGPALDILIAAVGARPDRTFLIGGFGIDRLRNDFPDVRIVESEGWQRMGSAGSLLAAARYLDGPAIITYGDVLFRPDLVDALRATGAAGTVAFDSCWRARYPGRRVVELMAREKVVVREGRATRLGSGISLDEASGEFVGVVHLGAEAIARMRALAGSSPDPRLRRLKVSELIDELMAEGTLGAVDVAGDWAEVDAPEDIARFVLGTKAETLARLRPLVRSARIADQVTLTVGEWEAEPDQAEALVRTRFGGARLIVRSSTTHEDGFVASNAGRFMSLLDVRVGEGLREAVARVAGSYRNEGIDAPTQQVLVQPLIEEVIVSGVALTRTLDHGAPWIVIEFSTDGDTETVTSGSSSSQKTLFLRRNADTLSLVGAAATTDLERLDPLLVALTEVERLLSHDALDVEFAIDASGVVHLLQVRPSVTAAEPTLPDRSYAEVFEEAHRAWSQLAVATSRIPGQARSVYGVMPDWNPAEIIGTAPSVLALDLYRRLITDEVWARQRAEVGYRDVRPSPLLRSFCGRPYVDVRASFTSFIPGDLDDDLAGRLLAAAIERLVARPELHDKVEFDVIPTCLAPDWPRWEKLLHSEGFTSIEVSDLHRSLAAITRRILSRVDDDLARIERLSDLRSIGSAMDPLTRARTLLEQAAVFGTLPFAHLARAAFVSVAILRGAADCGSLSSEQVETLIGDVRTVGHELTGDAAAVASGTLGWPEFVARWGHLRPGTYDLLSPRYDADPERFLRPLVELASSPDRGSSVPTQNDAWSAAELGIKAVLEDLGFDDGSGITVATLRRAIEGRERAKFAFSRNLSEALELIADAWGSSGLDRATLVDVPLDVLLAGFDGDGVGPDRVRELASEGRRRRLLAAAVQLPPLLVHESDLDVFVLRADSPNFVGTRPVTAPVVVLPDGGERVADSDLSGRIVLIPRADPGFDWIFGRRIVGLVTLYGGANSHMAIRAAEFGLPAAIGVGEQRYRTLLDAREIEIDPRARTLRRVV